MLGVYGDHLAVVEVTDIIYDRMADDDLGDFVFGEDGIQSGFVDSLGDIASVPEGGGLIAEKGYQEFIFAFEGLCFLVIIIAG